MYIEVHVWSIRIGWTGAMILVEGGNVKSLWTPKRANSQFEWWYSTSWFTEWTQIFTWNTAPANLYAKWWCDTWYVLSGDACEIIVYNITYNLNWWTNNSDNPTTYTVKSGDIILANATKTGYTFQWWTEQSSGFTWANGFIDLNTGEPIVNATYPNSYYTELIRLNAGEKYTLVGYGNYAPGDVRWRVYNLDGSYNGNLSSTDTYTATQDCYVRIMLYNNPTEDQRSWSRIITVKPLEIPAWSYGDREYYAGWKANTYTISYNLNKWTYGASHPTTARYDSWFVVNNPTRAGYSFVWWKITWMDSLEHTIGTGTTTATWIVTKETEFNNLNATNGSTVSFVAQWIDDIAPVATLTTKTDLKKTSQNATLKCTDGVWVNSYYWWTNPNPAIWDYTSVTSKTSQTRTKTVSSSGTYYLYCRDAAWNISAVKSLTYVAYQVKNMLNTITWAAWTYTTVNYELDNIGPSANTYYIITSGFATTLASVCTAPYVIIPSGKSTRKITSVWEPSPTTGATNVAKPAAKNTTYVCWYDRNTFALTLAASDAIFLKGAWTYKYGKKWISVRNRVMDVNGVVGYEIVEILQSLQVSLVQFWLHRLLVWQHMEIQRHILWHSIQMDELYIQLQNLWYTRLHMMICLLQLGQVMHLEVG